MHKLILDLYIRSPLIIKRTMANLEAIRRDFYRRNNIQNNKESIIDTLLNYEISNTIYDYNSLIEKSEKYVPFYTNYRFKKIDTLYDIDEIPILKKKDIIQNIKNLISKKITKKKYLWSGKTSGSTGSPLKFYKDPKSMKSERDSYESYYKYLGCDLKENRARISGVKVTAYEKKTPPYCLYVDKYKQLQCSAYHISKATYKDYLKEFERRSVSFGTGYPSGWVALAEAMIEDGGSYEGMKVIITDSEGLTIANKEIIEKAFNCQVYRTYGLGEVGMCAVECQNGNYHTLPTHYIEIVDNQGKSKHDGTQGEIVVTDFNSSNFPFIRYATGDLGIMNYSDCGCGFKTPFLEKIIGRIEDYIITKDGRKITRLSKIMSSGIGIKESQIIQCSVESLLINIVPDDNFSKSSMRKIVESLQELVGDMGIEWQEVDKLERMPSGKLKFLIRKI